MQLALESSEFIALVLGGVCVAAIVIIVVAPWRRIRSEPRISDEVEARLLLGENPTAIAEEEDEAARRGTDEGPKAEVFDLDPERRASGS